MSKFLPGPWEIDGEWGKNGGKRLASCPEGCSLHIAGIESAHKSSLQLILAAPDMYEALENLCKWAEREAKWDKIDDVYYKAKLALAKADRIN